MLFNLEVLVYVDYVIIRAYWINLITFALFNTEVNF